MRRDKKLDTAVSLWTVPEQVDEMRGKLHLKERDAKAFYESAEAKKIQLEEQIAKLRVENRNKRVALAQSINGDEKVIRSVFYQRREELLSMQRCTVAEATNVMDQKVCEASKRMNALQYQRAERQQRVQELNVALNRKKQIASIDFDADREREIRRLQNEMDKARIKYEAARNITERYEEIMTHMQEDCRVYPAKLDHLEQILREARTELHELVHMDEKAVRSREEARTELHGMEKEMYRAKRARDQQLTEYRKEVEKRKEPADRSEKKTRVAIVSDTSDAKAAKLQIKKAERQGKIIRLGDAFERIKKAINVSDINDIVYRVVNQDNTLESLKQQERDKGAQKTAALEEIQRLRREFADMRFNSQRNTAKGRKLVEDMEVYMKTEEKRCEDSGDRVARNNKLLLDLQSGIATLYEKLKDVKLKPPYHNYSKGDPVDDLANCARKLDGLIMELKLKKDMESMWHRVDFQKLHEYLESRLPPENLRIRIEEDEDEADDFHFDHDQDNEGLMTREDIKRHGQDMLNSKLKPKKKKTRKRNVTITAK